MSRPGLLSRAPQRRAAPPSRWQARMEAGQRILAAVDPAPTAAPAIEDHPDLGELGGLHGALAYLHDRWVTLFGVALDSELEDGGLPTPGATGRAARRVAARQPALVRVLDQYSSHPAVREGRARHRRLLEDVAGGPTEGG
jgi:hypothetical protein